MDKRVIQNDGQLSQAIHELRAWDFTYPMSLQFKRYVRPRTSGQQARLHAMIGEMAKANGVTLERMKIWLKDNSFPTVMWPGEFKVVFDQTKWFPMSEADLNVKQESKIIEQMFALGTEFGIQWENDDG